MALVDESVTGFIVTIKARDSIANKIHEARVDLNVIWVLAWRDILIRYKQTVLGLGWSLLRPILTMLVFVVVFGKVAKLPSDGVPYPLMVLSALIPWLFFSHTLTIGASSLIDNAPMLRRTYFSRIIMPTTPVIMHACDACLSLVVFMALSVIYGCSLTWRALFFPLLLLHASFLTLGVVYFFSSLAVRWRDVVLVIPFLVQIGFFVSPIGYSTSLVPGWLKYYFYMNPLVGLIEGFRWALLGGRMSFQWDAYCISLGLSIISFVLGGMFFMNQDHKVADVL